MVTIIVVVLVVEAAALAVYFKQVPGFNTPGRSTSSSELSSSSVGTCTAISPGSNIIRSSVTNRSFGAVTEFALPPPVLDPNALTVAPDGSVWFGEEALPGVGHLFSNGTLVEYRWPFAYPPSSDGYCGFSDIWGIALWNGSVWAPDAGLNQLVKVNPADGAVTSLHLPTNNSFPYSITVGPDNSLWFTELDSSKIGRVFPNGSLVEYPLSTGGLKEEPVQIAFQNSTLGYYVSIQATPSTAPSGIYSFNPQQHFSPSLVEQNPSLNYADSITLQGGGRGIWVALHGPSMVGFYNLTSRTLATYPTSLINYTNTALPYFVEANGSSNVWFNEHYGSRIAVINPAKDILTEYAETDPPASNISQVANVLTFALGAHGAWFASFTGNFIGYVNASYKPSFSVSLGSDPTIQLTPGQGTNVTLHVSGNSSQPLSLQFSDSESFTAIPKNITITSSLNTIPSLHGEQDLTVTVKAGEGLAPGNYTVLITVNGGLIRESVYVMLKVSP